MTPPALASSPGVASPVLSPPPSPGPLSLARTNEVADIQTSRFYTVTDELLKYLQAREPHTSAIIQELNYSLLGVTRRFSNAADFVSGARPVAGQNSPADHSAELYALVDKAVSQLHALPAHAADAAHFRDMLNRILLDSQNMVQATAAARDGMFDHAHALDGATYASHFSARHGVARVLRRVVADLQHLERAGVSNYILLVTNERDSQSQVLATSARFADLATSYLDFDAAVAHWRDPNLPSPAPAAAALGVQAAAPGVQAAAPGVQAAAPGVQAAAPSLSNSLSQAGLAQAAPSQSVPSVAGSSGSHTVQHVTLEELRWAFEEACTLRKEAQQAQDAVQQGSCDLDPKGPAKRKKLEAVRTFHERIGIGNIGKRGGQDTRSGVNVNMVDLCNYIFQQGGWESMKNDREKKMQLLKAFGWSEDLAPEVQVEDKEDKAIQSLTTQVREYFCKSGVFDLLSSRRASEAAASTGLPPAASLPIGHVASAPAYKQPSLPSVHSLPVAAGMPMLHDAFARGPSLSQAPSLDPTGVPAAQAVGLHALAYPSLGRAQDQQHQAAHPQQPLQPFAAPQGRLVDLQRQHTHLQQFVSAPTPAMHAQQQQQLLQPHTHHPSPSSMPASGGLFGMSPHAAPASQHRPGPHLESLHMDVHPPSNLHLPDPSLEAMTTDMVRQLSHAHAHQLPQRTTNSGVFDLATQPSGSSGPFLLSSPSLQQPARAVSAQYDLARQQSIQQQQQHLLPHAHSSHHLSNSTSSHQLLAHAQSSHVLAHSTSSQQLPMQHASEYSGQLSHRQQALGDHSDFDMTQQRPEPGQRLPSAFEMAQHQLQLQQQQQQQHQEQQMRQHIQQQQLQQQQLQQEQLHKLQALPQAGDVEMQLSHTPHPSVAQSQAFNAPAQDDCAHSAPLPPLPPAAPQQVQAALQQHQQQHQQMSPLSQSAPLPQHLFGHAASAPSPADSQMAQEFLDHLSNPMAHPCSSHTHLPSDCVTDSHFSTVSNHSRGAPLSAQLPQDLDHICPLEQLMNHHPDSASMHNPSAPDDDLSALVSLPLPSLDCSPVCLPPPTAATAFASGPPSWEQPNGAPMPFLKAPVDTTSLSADAPRPYSGADKRDRATGASPVPPDAKSPRVGGFVQ